MGGTYSPLKEKARQAEADQGDAEGDLRQQKDRQHFDGHRHSILDRVAETDRKQEHVKNQSGSTTISSKENNETRPKKDDDVY